MGTIEREIRAELAPMFERAEAERLWFWCSYQDIWLSPAELRAEQDQGRLIWGAVNWKLRDPAEMIAERQARVDAAQRELDAVRRRVDAWRAA